MTVLALIPAIAEQDRIARDAAAAMEALNDARLLSGHLITRLERLSPRPDGKELTTQALHVIETYDRWLELKLREPLTLDEEDALVALKGDLDAAIRKLVSGR